MLGVSGERDTGAVAGYVIRITEELEWAIPENIPNPPPPPPPPMDDTDLGT